MSTNFSELKVSKMLAKIDEISKLLRSDQYETIIFVKTSEKIIKILNEEMSELLCMSDLLIELKSDLLKPRHWELILTAIKKPHFLNITFKLQDLKDSNLDRYASKLKNIIEQAKEENKHEACLTMVKNI